MLPTQDPVKRESVDLFASQGVEVFSIDDLESGTLKS